nr:hypothetical protein [Candidatus Sigynarchaeota archaeon]
MLYQDLTMYIIWGAVAVVAIIVLRVIFFILDNVKKKSKKEVIQESFKGLPPSNLAAATGAVQPKSTTTKPAKKAAIVFCGACGWKGTTEDEFCGSCGAKMPKS